ncbi:WD40 repeat-like protein [Sistotremastrum suecicum HHB10207 ss-3]|uniref:Protein HIR n=1 Tax=Sistotremastrum suecicum HHB10207 ss-3 TaxID=1314776 RepID=A0A166A6P8_9AGAM|nr:WD40 repeat-like protein [Sistotremastrum suecicum HHB10207 ss-3]
MRFTKPSWVAHTDSSAPEGSSTAAKALTMFSLHVHPDNSRIATGGLDAKVRIWATAPILSKDVEESGKIPKSLATLTMHTGPVLAVRWAHSGRWLASGSDDSVILIWDLDPAGSGKVWGSDDVNVEGWKALKRLPGHESDVTGLAWSPGDRYLASVGADSMVIIWDGYTLERMKKLDLHQGFVKGVCWDPVGEFLATCADDKSVKFWRVTDWGLEATISKPFEDSPGNTFFRRLSWSPDGAHITVANACNGKGMVFVAAVIARSTWTSEISLVGHEHTVQAVAYNPHMFLRDVNQPIQTQNLCSVVALGGDDCSVSVWQTKSARPMIVARDAFARGILDLSWSWDGLTLYACSSDGTLAAFAFTPEEMEGILPVSAQEKYLQKFGFKDPRIRTVNVPPPADVEMAHVPQASTGFGSQTIKQEVVTTLVARKGKAKKRVTLDNIPSAGVTTNGFGHHGLSAPNSAIGMAPPPISPAMMGSINMGIPSQLPPAPSPSMTSHIPPHSNNVTPAFGSMPSQGLLHSQNVTPSLGGQQQPFPWSSQHTPRGEIIDLTAYGEPADPTVAGGGTDAPMVDSLDTPTTPVRGKNKGSAGVDANGKAPKPRTLGGDKAREDMGPVRVLRPAGGVDVNEWRAAAHAAGGGHEGVRLLAAPDLKSLVVAKIEGTDEVLEGSNDDATKPSEVTLSYGKQVQWLDYLPSRILLLTLTPFFCAVALEDSSITVYSPTGRRIMPTMSLSSQCAIFEGSKNHLMAITVQGQMHIWNVRTQRTLFPPVSVSSLLTTPNSSILSATLRPNGSPLVHLSSGTSHSYDANLQSFIRISDSWWATGSDAWTTRQRTSTTGVGPVQQMESVISELRMNAAAAAAAASAASAAHSREGSAESSGGAGGESKGASSTVGTGGLVLMGGDETERPPWWSAAMTLGHLETRMHAARVLESPTEFKQALLVYSKKIADEAFRGKAEELIKELCGPVYWRPGREESWTPTVCGLAKRDLLKDILSIFARSKTLTKLAQDWQETLRRAAAEDL